MLKALLITKHLPLHRYVTWFAAALDEVVVSNALPPSQKSGKNKQENNK